MYKYLWVGLARDGTSQERDARGVRKRGPGAPVRYCRLIAPWRSSPESAATLSTVRLPVCQPAEARVRSDSTLRYSCTVG